MVKIIFCLFIAFLCNFCDANVIGLDFGSDAMKVAIVQPGSPLDIVGNFQSKRKTPTCITFYRGERMFGADAMALMSRKPELTFAKAYRMLGRSVDHPLVKEVLKQYFPYEVYGNETTGTTCLKQEETYYSPEELIAMLMQHAKDMALSQGGKVIKDCVVTVPSSFTQHERKALYTAAEIADLKVLSLIEENTAAALHYGIDRVFEEPSTVIFYNMGSSAVQVSIATYSAYTIKEGGKNKTIGQFDIVGKGWDSSLGGFAFDVRLAEMLAEKFNIAWNKKASGKGKDLKDFFRPMTRLRVEAAKVKEVLSANNEFPVKAEQLHDETDLNTKITRVEFEAACEDLFARLTAPIDAALKMADIDLSKVNSVELLGGGVRMPRVKKMLDDYFKSSKLELGQHMNGDEAMALGAAFRAANLSTAFRVRKVGATDVSSFGVSVRLETLPTVEPAGGSGFFGSLLGRKKPVPAVEGETAWAKHTSLYPYRSQVPNKSKTVAFHYASDILCKIEYDDEIPLPEGAEKILAVYNITGIADFAKEHADKDLGAPKVHLSFSLDGSGIVSLSKAEATYELPVEPEVEEVEEEKEEGGIEPEVVAEKAEGADVNSTAPESSESNDTAPATPTAEEKKELRKKKAAKDKKKNAKKIKKDNVLRKALSISENHLLVSPSSWSPLIIAESKAKLRALNAQDDSRKAKEAALNDLEAYIYKIKNRLGDDEEALKAVSTEEQRQEVLDLGNETEEWLYDEGRGADVSEFKKKHNTIRRKAEDIFTRLSEHTSRPAAVKKTLEMLADVKGKVINTWGEKLPQVTEEEKTTLLELIAKTETWIGEKVAAQELKTPFEEPVFESLDLTVQLKPVSHLFQRLLNKPKPPPPKVNITSNATDTNSTESTEPVKVNINVNETSTEESVGVAEEEIIETPAESEKKSEL
mmetsp:Transcript_12702/g.12343  ORF Transcript_12702/g.12343 Transcript_12702/m.12343 type:complete len:926 (+) Transcript_12702:120-2897(+)|eukprot:CAMPEP_0119035226 /NCGR_PEP_ID=MMETSP1177-20130426/2165_1 /TAXON_ID=2985 /ORGANISM="Ochromonas sp, Strain CCMP1899" /LENGTH=925 /DNA_ID=CAMNT_0006993209 /DNA_START=111 /DNA_END=2888 /DNA_ORIENTATION=-